MNPTRSDTIAQLAQLVCRGDLDHPTRVAVDGITACGKSTLARELDIAVAALGRPTIHLSMDGYHHPREYRHRKGALSAEGYYDDAYDFPAFVRGVLLPLGPGGDRHYGGRIIDLASNEATDDPILLAPIDAVLIVDGTFLQRPEIGSHWDQRIFVSTSFEVALARGVARDRSLLGGETAARTAYEARYHAAARLYIEAVHPADSATIVVDNDNLESPRLHTQSADS
jgi:uridine kinase